MITAHHQLPNSGERLKRARILAGISTRREFESRYKISANTLQGWEQGKNPLSQKGARRVVEAFKREGLICSIDWLMHGTGMPPRPYEMINTGLDTDSGTSELAALNLREEEAIYQETQLFKRQNHNSLIISIADDAMDPYYSAGDYVGGIKLGPGEAKHYLGNPCIVELEDHAIIARFLHAGTEDGLYSVSSSNPRTTAAQVSLQNIKILSAAPIIWHRKKLAAM